MEEGTWLGISIHKKDPRSVADHRLNVSQQCDVVAKKVNAALMEPVSKSEKVLHFILFYGVSCSVLGVAL